MTSGVQHGMTGAVVFQREQLVRFGHCDPAGIVFYPRYFEMLNELVEDWFAQGLGQSFARLITESGLGMPTAQLDTRFLRISRACADKFGLGSTDDAIGKTDADIFTEEHAQAAGGQVVNDSAARSEVSLNTLMKWPIIGGIVLRRAWGSATNAIVRVVERPKAFAASY